MKRINIILGVIVITLILNNCQEKSISLYGENGNNVATYFGNDLYHLRDKCDWQKRIYCACDLLKFPPECSNTEKDQKCISRAYCKE